MKVYTILPNALFVRGKSNHLPIDPKRSFADRHRLGMVVNLWTLADSDWNLLNIPYFHFAIPDGAKLDWLQQTALAEMADTAALRIRAGRSVLIQCHAGRNRSAFLAAQIVQRLEGCSGSEALALVREARPRAVANPMFERLLEEGTA